MTSTLGELTAKDFDVVLLNYLNMLWGEKKRVLSTGKGDVCFVPNVLDVEHLRTVQNNGVVAAHGTECFTMHFSNGVGTSLCLLNVGRTKKIHVLDKVMYARCAGQMEHGISKGHRVKYGGCTFVKSLSPLDGQHTHRGYACDLEPIWFDSAHRDDGYKCEGHRDCSPIFVS